MSVNQPTFSKMKNLNQKSDYNETIKARKNRNIIASTRSIFLKKRGAALWTLFS